MDIHQNARLTLRSREALVETVIRGQRFSPAAASFHVTPKTAAKWFRRYHSEGVAGLRDRRQALDYRRRSGPVALSEM